MNTSNLKPYLYLVLSMIIWGASYIWTANALTTYSSITIVFLRIFLAGFFLFGISMALKKLQKIQKKHIKIFAILGLLDPFGYFVFETLGVEFSTPTIAAIIIATVPVFLPFFAVFFLKEKLSFISIIGFIVSFIGVLLVVIKDDLSFSAQPLGFLFLALAVIFSISSIIVLKKLTATYNEFTVISYLNLVSIIYFLPVFLTFEWNNFINIVPSTKIITNIVALSIGGSTIAFLLYVNALGKLDAAKANYFVNLIPVFTAIFSYLFLEEIISLRMFIGILIVICGVLISQIKRPIKKGRVRKPI